MANKTEDMKAYKKEYHKKNRERLLERGKLYYNQTRLERSVYRKLWLERIKQDPVKYAEHLKKGREYYYKRRAANKLGQNQYQKDQVV